MERVRSLLASSATATELLAVIVAVAITMAVASLGGFQWAVGVPGPWWLGVALLFIPGVAIGVALYVWIKRAA